MRIIIRFLLCLALQLSQLSAFTIKPRLAVVRKKTPIWSRKGNRTMYAKLLMFAVWMLNNCCLHLWCHNNSGDCRCRCLVLCIASCLDCRADTSSHIFRFDAIRRVDRKTLDSLDTVTCESREALEEKSMHEKCTTVISVTRWRVWICN